MKILTTFLKQVYRLKIARNKYHSKNIANLYWYDLNLNNALSFKGIIKILFLNLFTNLKDDNASAYGYKTLYFGQPLGDGIKKSGATVWNCTSLSNTSIIENDQTCQFLEEHYLIIKKELNKNLSLIGEHPDNKTLVQNGEWSGIFLYQTGGEKNDDIVNFFPETFEIIEKLNINKNFGFVMISKLKAGTIIDSHCGSSNLRFRYHLGIDIPEPKSVKIRIGETWKHWEQGKAFGFDDSFEHEVIHSGAKDRIVLVIDVWNNQLTSKDIEFLSLPIFQTFGKIKE